MNSGLFRTDDYGKTWTRIVGRNVHSAVVKTMISGWLAVSTSDSVPFSSDSVTTWKALQELPNRWFVEGLAFAGDRLIAGTSGNGAFWTDLPNFSTSAH